jgi:hypothetical protein
MVFPYKQIRNQAFGSIDLLHQKLFRYIKGVCDLNYIQSSRIRLQLTACWGIPRPIRAVL